MGGNGVHLHAIVHIHAEPDGRAVSACGWQKKLLSTPDPVNVPLCSWCVAIVHKLSRDVDDIALRRMDAAVEATQSS